MDYKCPDINNKSINWQRPSSEPRDKIQYIELIALRVSWHGPGFDKDLVVTKSH